MGALVPKGSGEASDCGQVSVRLWTMPAIVKELKQVGQTKVGRRTPW